MGVLSYLPEISRCRHSGDGNAPTVCTRAYSPPKRPALETRVEALEKQVEHQQQVGRLVLRLFALDSDELARVACILDGKERA